MTQHLSAWGLIAVGIALANLPFLTSRIAGLAPVPHGNSEKPALIACLEWSAYYGLWLGTAHWLETRQGPAQVQSWEFYAVTLALFAVFAFPGFCRRYFWGKGVF